MRRALKLRIRMLKFCHPPRPLKEYEPTERSQEQSAGARSHGLPSTRKDLGLDFGLMIP